MVLRRARLLDSGVLMMLKPLYMLIKVEIDKDYITNQQHADEFAEDFGVMHECKIVDTYYPDDEQYPYIAK